MKRHLVSFFVVGVLCLVVAPAMLAADQAPTVETQLRERLRDTILQLRASETDRANLQAAQTQWADEKKALTEKLGAITKEANVYKQIAKDVDSLKSQAARQDQEITQLKEANENCRQAAEQANRKAAEQVKHAHEAMTDLQRLVVDRQEKNLALYKIANEILERYRKFSLGEALSAREPFVGITRVKLENLVQDYQDKIANERTTLDQKDLESFHDQRPNQPQQASK